MLLQAMIGLSNRIIDCYTRCGYDCEGNLALMAFCADEQSQYVMTAPRAMLLQVLQQHKLRTRRKIAEITRQLFSSAM